VEFRHKLQGKSWEDYLQANLRKPPIVERLGWNFWTVDFSEDVDTNPSETNLVEVSYDKVGNIVYSAKTMNLTTTAKINTPVQVYYSLKRYIDKLSIFTTRTGQNANGGTTTVTVNKATKKVLDVAFKSIPTKDQWFNIERSCNYADAIYGIQLNVYLVQ
jgi:hypothetical protein